MRYARAAALLCIAVVVSGLPAVGQTPSDWLVIGPVDGGGRRPFRPDAVFEAYLAEPGARLPKVGETLSGESGEAKWRPYHADEPGSISTEARTGWAFARFEVDKAGDYLATLNRGGRFFLDGAGFFGDPYGYGFGGTPVHLEAGSHEVFVTGLRGAAKFGLKLVETGLVPATWDVLVPDIVVGDLDAWETDSGEAALELPILNASGEPFAGGRYFLREARPAAPEDVLEGVVPEAFRPRLASVSGELAAIPALGRAALWIPFEPGPGFGSVKKAAVVELELFLLDQAGEVAPLEDELREPDARFEVRLVDAKTTRRVAFSSLIDGSLQEYGLVPATGEHPDGLVLSLHGASVPAMNQARAYQAKEGLAIACPLNRRPYGFDWQDWGRMDAYEALGAALEQTGVDDERVVLTGHSMGGHGTWHLAVNDPDRFLAVAPSAGWASFDTYGGRPEGSLASLWQAADGASLTLDLIGNLKDAALYVLHGTADDNVPISEAKTLVAALEEAGGEATTHYEEGAGHWWGNQCVDWPPIFELFHKVLAGVDEDEAREQPGHIDFITADPGVDSEHYWVRVLQPRFYGEPVHVVGDWDAKERTLEVSAPSAGALRLEAPNRNIPLLWIVDGQKFAGSPTQRSLWVQRGESGSWQAQHPGKGEKGPSFAGPFKRAFDRDFVFVVGTAGDAACDAALFETARFLQADWSYRAGGEIDLVRDKEFLAIAGKWDEYDERNVILFGNRDTNAAWGYVLGATPPVDVFDGGVTLGETAYEGDDLLALFVLPRKGDQHWEPLAGVFGSSGVLGARLAYEVPVFVSGVGLPDWTVIDRSVLAEGDGGVVATGYFDRQWQLAAPLFERAVEVETPQD